MQDLQSTQSTTSRNTVSTAGDDYCSISVMFKPPAQLSLVPQGRVSIEDAPHPWHIEIPEQFVNRPEVYQLLVDFHIAGKIQVGDKISGSWQNCLTNISYIAKIFSGEYSVQPSDRTGGATCQTMTRVVVKPDANILTSLPQSSEDLIDGLERYGHVVLRLGEAIEEKTLLSLLNADSVMDYRYGNTERKKIAGSKALRVTPWPKELMLPAHNEMTYHLEFPKYVIFTCQETSELGGETSIYDCAVAYQNLPDEMKAKLAGRHVLCCKRYVESEEHHCYPSWHQVLGREASIEEVIEDFQALGYVCRTFQEEEPEGPTTVLETRLPRPIVYEQQGVPCLHASMIPLVPYWYGQLWPDRVPPLMAVWDDGAPITPEEFHVLHDAMLSARICYGGWQQHDVLILDNPRIAHGRLPFVGDRTIGVMMTQPTSFDEVTS